MSSIRRYALAALASAVFAGSAVAKDYELLNVSYDPTRELYQDYNAEFTSFWKQSAEFFLDPRESGCPASNQGPTWAPSFSSWFESGS